jgi:hypothetical protein
MNIPYRASNYIGRRNRKRFAAQLHRLADVESASPIDVDVYSFSNERDIPEQVASIRTFLKFVGKPHTFTVVSDESHSESSKRLLCKIDSSVRVVPYTALLRADTPQRVLDFAKMSPMGKKLGVLYSIEPQRATLYADSDILFFPNAKIMRNLITPTLPQPLHLLDCWPSLDARLLRSEDEKIQPVNAGFFCFSHRLHWDEAFRRLGEMDGEPIGDTEQTCVHFALKASGAIPFPPEMFVLRNEDQFHFHDGFAREPIAVRHYISSLRTKFWHHYALFA